MNITSDVLAPFIGLNGFGNKPGGTGGTGLSTLGENYSSKLSWRDQRSTDVTLVTGDGDRVTLSSSTDRQASYQVYNSSGSINGTSTSARIETFSLSSGKSMSISVEGELSEQERADIALVASTVDKMATEFFNGDVDTALASILDAGGTGSGTISSISASMSHSQSFSFTHQSAAAPGTLPADGTAAPAPPSGAIAPDGTAAPQGAPATTGGATVPQGAATPAPQEPGVITLGSTLDLINEMSSTVSGMGVDLGKIEEELFELMDELFKEIAEEQDPNKAMDKLVHFVKEEFLHELKEIIEDASGHDDDHDDHDDDDDHHNRIDGDHDNHHRAPAPPAPAVVTQPAATQPPVPQVDAGSVATAPQPTAETPV